MDMKKIIFTLLLVVLGFGAANADKYTLDRSALPEEAQQMLKEHFPKAKVSMIKVDRHLLKTSVDCKKREVPQGLVMKPIQRYVTKNFPGVKIVKIEKDFKGFEVDLSDGVELKFDRLGTFKGADVD